jgi:hypothetical protein
MAGAAFRAGWFLFRNAGDARRKNGETPGVVFRLEL